MSRREGMRLMAGATAVYLFAFVSALTSGEDFDAPLLVGVLLVAAIARLIHSGESPPAGASGEFSNKVRGAMVLAVFIGFLVFPDAIEDTTDRVAASTLLLGGIFALSAVFITRRTQGRTIVLATVAATVAAMTSGANRWWLIPLLTGVAYTLVSLSAADQLPVRGGAQPVAFGPRAVLGMALAAGAAMLVILLLPDPPSPSSGGAGEPGATPATPAVPVTPPEPRDIPWLLLLLGLLLLVALAAFIWWLWRRRRPWGTTALSRFARAGRSFDTPLNTADTLPQFADRFPVEVAPVARRVARGLDAGTFTDRGVDSMREQVEPDLHALEHIARANRVARWRARWRATWRRLLSPRPRIGS